MSLKSEVLAWLNAENIVQRPVELSFKNSTVIIYHKIATAMLK